jgi:Ran GTPase-activating protein (RanGAP) involved in mRNA processing and transport
MSDTDSDADSISGASSAPFDVACDEALISVTVRELCNQLRANDPRVFTNSAGGSFFIPFYQDDDYIGRQNSEAECIAVFEALKENTSVKCIDFDRLFGGMYTKSSVLVAVEYVESSTTLQALYLSVRCHEGPHEIREMISLVLRALSRNTSVTRLIIHIDVVRLASVAFQELLTCTQTLQKLEIIGFANTAFDKMDTNAIVSGFASNTTLSDLKFQSWPEADLAPALTALQDHPALQKIHFSPSDEYADYFPLPSLSGLEVLLRSQHSKVKELVIEQVDPHTVGLRPVLQELARNTTVINMAIHNSVLSREDVQQLTAVLRQNTTLLSLDLESSALGSAGLAEIAPALYRNTSIKTLDLTTNDLDDIESSKLLRELLRRNKTITSLCLDRNVFGRNTAAARSIFEGVRSNTSLQQLDLRGCGLRDQGISLLANALVARNASMVELALGFNEITVVGLHALLDNGVEAVKTLAKLNLTLNPIGSGGATILADALGRNVMPSLKQLDLNFCGIEDDGFVAVVSALEQNTSLQILDLKNNDFGERGFMAFAESLPNIKGLQDIGFKAHASFQSTLPLLLEGFRTNTSLVEVNYEIDGCENTEWSQELHFLGQRNRFTPLLKASDPPDASPPLGIWSQALAKVATEPDVLFHVLRNKPKLVGAAGVSKKRKRDDE